MQRRYKLLLLLIVLIGVPYYWLLVDSHEPNVPERRIDITELRRLAAAMPGSAPDRVVEQEVAWRLLPGTFMVAGGGLKRNNVVVQSFLLTRPGPDIVIDSGISEGDAKALGLHGHMPEKQRRIENAIRNAGLILFTHEHVDHMGGFARMPEAAALAAKALVTEEQLQGDVADALPWPSGLRERIRPFRYRGMAAVAPGVVLIRTPGHTPGSQMIFVRLANGREYLFTGDTATMERSWRMQRPRSRLLSDFLAPENRAEVLGWLQAVATLKREAPELVVVPGHDFEHTMNSEHRSGIYYDFARMEPMPPPQPAQRD